MDERTKTIDRIVRNFAPHTPGCWAAVAAAYDAAVAAERERIAAHFDERDRGRDGKPLGLGFYEPQEPAEIIRALGPNVGAKLPHAEQPAPERADVGKGSKHTGCHR